MKTEDLKIQFLRFEDLKTALFCHFLPHTDDTEDLKTPYLKSEDSKYACMCWEPHVTTGELDIFVTW